MRISIYGASVAQDTDNLANNVTAAAGAAFTLITDEISDGLAHKLIITPSGSVTGNYTITGLDANGHSYTETLATNTTNAVTSANYYASNIVVTAPSGLGAETVDIGWTADSVSAMALPYHNVSEFNIGFGCVIGNSPTYTVQHTYDGNTWFNHSSVAAETTNQEGSYTSPVLAIRLMWAAAGTVTLTGYQAGA